jgi:hypothetical protein
MSLEVKDSRELVGRLVRQYLLVLLRSCPGKLNND